MPQHLFFFVTCEDKNAICYLEPVPSRAPGNTHLHPSCSPVTLYQALPPQIAKGESGWAAKAASCLANNQPPVQRAPNLTSPSSPPSPGSPPSGLESAFLSFFLPWLLAAPPSSAPCFRFPRGHSQSSGSAISQHHLLPILASTIVPFKFSEAPGPGSLSHCVHPAPVFGKQE